MLYKFAYGMLAYDLGVCHYDFGHGASLNYTVAVVIGLRRRPGVTTKALSLKNNSLMGCLRTHC